MAAPLGVVVTCTPTLSPACAAVVPLMSWTKPRMVPRISAYCLGWYCFMYHIPPRTMTIKRNMVPSEGSRDGRGGRYGAGRIAESGVEAVGAGAAATPDPDDGGAYGLGAILLLPDGVAAAATLPELESRSSRRRSAPISAAVWQRMSRSFSRALWITLSS